MKIMYKFADGTVSEVEVSEEIGEVITESIRLERNQNERVRNHCFSTELVKYEGAEFGTCDTYDFLEDNELKEKIHKAFNSLTDVQKRRLLMLAKGMSLRAIAKVENTSFQSVDESIKAAKKKFLKNFIKHPDKTPLKSVYSERLKNPPFRKR